MPFKLIEKLALRKMVDVLPNFKPKHVFSKMPLDIGIGWLNSLMTSEKNQPAKSSENIVSLRTTRKRNHFQQRLLLIITLNVFSGSEKPGAHPERESAIWNSS